MCRLALAASVTLLLAIATTDAQVAGGDPCTQCPCPEDLDRDGRVGFPDLLALLAAWGGCLEPYACEVPWTCETKGTICNDSPLCVCFELFDGETFCVDLLADCNDMPFCPDGTCPPGLVCLIDSCCGETRCISLEWACLPGATGARPRPAIGTPTVTGTAGADGSASVGPCDLCFCPADLDRDGAAGVPDLLRVLGAWGACR